MRLETDRLILRPMERADLASIQKNFAHWDIIKYLVKTVPWPYPEDGAQSYFENVIEPGRVDGTEWSWSLFLNSAPTEAIGALSVHYDKDKDVYGRGVWLGLAHHGKGYMTEATIAVNDYAFNVLEVGELIITNASGNKASSRLKEKVGGVLLEVRPTDRYHDGVTEEEVWQLTAENWRAFRKGAGK